MGLFRPLNRGQTLEFSASWALGPKPTGNRHQPGLGHLGDIHTDTKVNGHTPLPSRTRAFPSGREGLRAGGPTLQGSARRLHLQTDPPQPSSKGPEAPIPGSCQAEGPLHNSAIQTSPPQSGHRQALEQMQKPQTSYSQWGVEGAGGRQALLGSGAGSLGPSPLQSRGSGSSVPWSKMKSNRLYQRT